MSTKKVKLPQVDVVELAPKVEVTVPLHVPATTLDEKEESGTPRSPEFVAALKLTQSLTILTDDHDTIIETALDKFSCCLSFLLDDRSPFNENTQDFEERCKKLCATTEHRVKEDEEKKENILQKYEDHIRSLYDPKYEKEFWKDMNRHFMPSSSNTKSSIFQITKIIESEIDKVRKVREATDARRKEHSFIGRRPVTSTIVFESVKDITERRGRDPDQLATIEDVSSMRQWLKSLKEGDTTDSYKEIDDALAFFSGNDSITKMKQYDIEDVKSLKLSILMGNRPMSQWQWFHVVPWIEKIDKLNQFASLFWEWQISGAELCRMDPKTIGFLIQCSHGYTAENDRLTDLIYDLIYAIERNLLLSVVTYEYESIYELIAMLATKKKKDENAERAETIYGLLEFLRAKRVDGPKVLWKLDVFYLNKVDNILAVLLVGSNIRKLFHVYFPRYLLDPAGPDAKVTSPKHISGSPQVTREEVSFALSYDKPNAQAEGEMRQGMIDMFMEALGTFVDGICCAPCKCGPFIKQFDRRYLRVILFLLFALSLGCLTTWFWMRRRSRMEIGIAIRWSAEAIAERAIQAMEYEFFVPQMLINIAIGGLLNGDITLGNPDEYVSNAQYDEFLVQYRQYTASQKSVYALYVYESRDDTVIGSFTEEDADTSVIYVFNGTCGVEYRYDDSTKQRDTNDMEFEGCWYYPQSRPWFTKAADLALYDSGWTEPYLFSENNQIGMSLVHKINYDGFDVIFIAEFTIHSIENIFYSFENVKGGITYLITPGGSVIASDIGEIDCNDDTVADCSATNALLLNSVELLRTDADVELDGYNNATVITTDDFAITLYSFKSVYLDSPNTEYGAIAVVYDNEHLAFIETAEIWSMIVYIVSTVAIVLILCCLDRCKIHGMSDEEILLRRTTEEEETKEDDDAQKPKEERKFHTYFLAQFLNIYKCSFWYTSIVFLLTFLIWENNVDPLWHETMDIFYNEEYLIVQDKVMSVVYAAQTITDIVEERFTRGDMRLSNGHIPIKTDVFLANVMESFKDANGEYLAYMVYIATPDGMMIGARQETDNETDHSLRIALRDNSTEWEYKHYAVNSSTLEREDSEDSLFEINDWDPRCRGWYELTLSYMFDGDILNAFGGDGGNTNLFDFEESISSSECIDAVAYYANIWNVSDDEIEESRNASAMGLEVNNIYSNATNYNLVWTQYLFSSSGSMGLTATKPLMDADSGALLGIVAVDFALNRLSSFLNSTAREDGWYSWIMRTDNYEMLASSDREVTQPIYDNDLSCVTISGTCYEINNLLPYKATQHPNFYIRVVSQEIDLFYNFYDNEDSLPINTSTSPEYLNVPLDLPQSLSGRLLTSPFHNNSAVELNWIIVKLMNVDVIKAAEEDDSKVISFLLLVILYAVYRVQSRLSQSEMESKDTEMDSGDESDDDDESKSRKYEHIDDAKKYQWLKDEMEEMVKYSSVKTWTDFNDNFESEIGNHPIRTSMATDFMAKQSNMHIETKKHGDLTMMLYALQSEHRDHDEGASGRMLRFVDAYWYNTFMNVIICLHLLFIMYLPVSPDVLSSEQFSNPECKTAIIAISFLIIIEIFDIFVIACGRYIEFGALSLEYSKSFTRLKYGQHHRFVDEIEKHSPFWLMFFGTASWKYFIIHIVLIALIILDTALMMLDGVNLGIFTYYIPIVPILLVVRSKTIREFSIQFFYAIYYAKEILISYFVLILIVSILASAVFSPILNPTQSVDTFASSIRALISSFVFVSTGENYNEIVYSAIDANTRGDSGFWFREIHNTIGVINLSFFVMVSIIGLYFFIPIMIFKFENAFDHSRKVNDNVVSRNKLRSKINLSIAAFIWLDMTDDGTISKKEFDLFAHSSVISRTVLLDAFEYADNIDDDDAIENKHQLSLYEFVSTMMNGFHLFTVGIDSRKCYGSKFRTMLECNVFRRDRNRHYLLIYLIIPSILVALLRGLGDIDEFILNTLVHIFFFVNFIDINLRWYAFGWYRYLSLIKYRNPPRVQQAIYNWMRLKGSGIHYMRGHEEDAFERQTLELIHSEREWVTKNLLPTRPQTLWQKRTLSVIHSAELYLIWFSAAGWIATFIAPNKLNGYYYFFIQLYLFRLFTLVTDNQRLFALIFAILPHTINILAFLFIFMFFYARIGCTLFGDKTDYVLRDVYSAANSNANFNTLGSSILTLMQLMIGEGWHEIMYLHMIATRVEYCAYFIIYIVVVTLIISNIFIGLFLSEIEDLDNQQQHDEFINQWIDTSSRKSKLVAAKRRNKLFNQLNQLKQAIKTTNKQIQKIDNIFRNYRHVHHPDPASDADDDHLHHQSS